MKVVSSILYLKVTLKMGNNTDYSSHCKDEVLLSPLFFLINPTSI